MSSEAARDALSITPAARADLGDIHELIRELARYERLEHLCSGSAAELEAALFCPAPAAEVLIARIGDQLAGFALFFHNFSTFLARRGLWLEDLYVRPHWRGRGIGRALLRSLADIARERGCGRFEWAVLDWNESAIGFYQRLGASVLPDWRIVRVTGPAIESMATPPADASP